jgi:hypothetical protein
MKTLKLSFIWVPDFKETIFYYLIVKLSKLKIEIVNPNKCDLLFIGPYDQGSYKRKVYNSIKSKFKFFHKLEEYFKNLEIYQMMNRSSAPLKVFLSSEAFPHNLFKADFYITSNLGVFDNNHLRFPCWKNDIDWSHEGIVRDNNVGNAKRFGFFYDIESLLKNKGDDFLKKKNICFFTTVLKEPRRSFYKSFSKQFRVDGFGPYFDKKLKNHNESKFKKFDIMKNYSFNLCPENILYPGSYTEKIPDAFIGKCLPISWADNTVKIDFNPNAFINLNDHLDNDFQQLFDSLRDVDFLKKYSKEPLLLKKPNLDSEIKFVERILASL